MLGIIVGHWWDLFQYQLYNILCSASFFQMLAVTSCFRILNWYFSTVWPSLWSQMFVCRSLNKQNFNPFCQRRMNRDYSSAVKINSALLFLFENGSLAGKSFWNYAWPHFERHWLWFPSSEIHIKNKKKVQRAWRGLLLIEERSTIFMLEDLCCLWSYNYIKMAKPFYGKLLMLNSAEKTEK